MKNKSVRPQLASFTQHKLIAAVIDQIDDNCKRGIPIPLHGWDAVWRPAMAQCLNVSNNIHNALWEKFDD